uniref:Thrombospondin-type laminin G domain and EAR repeats a n=1 Tax=Eptatretus burgeri TaxID=7764 RepID=A0A8C4Q7T2_EPTBU
MDCGVTMSRTLKTSFPAELSTSSTTVHVGNRGRRKGTFTGLLRQLVLLPGADAVRIICPSTNPATAELHVPHSLLATSPLRPGEDERFEMKLRLTLREEESCRMASAGIMWFDSHRRVIQVCDGKAWVSLYATKQLSYVEEYGKLLTDGRTRDIEIFRIDGVGLFAAAASENSGSGSTIFKWDNGTFHQHQVISTEHAQKWEFFTIGRDIFLAVANLGGEKESRKRSSVVYRWNRRLQLFLPHQHLHTNGARDVEAFRLQGSTYLVVANHIKEHKHVTESIIYKWNCNRRRFEEHQAIVTSGAYDWEFFSVGAFSFLVVANSFNGSSTHVDSAIYVLQGERFVLFQTIKTRGATDWEPFTIDERHFLAVANSVSFTPPASGLSEYVINSTIYELDLAQLMFVKFQDILTYSATDWEFFTVGDDSFLIVANSFDGSSNMVDSIIYRWQGYERFVPVHHLPTTACADWEKVDVGEESFLLFANAKSKSSSVLRLKVA